MEKIFYATSNIILNGCGSYQHDIKVFISSLKCHWPFLTSNMSLTGYVYQTNLKHKWATLLLTVCV